MREKMTKRRDTARKHTLDAFAKKKKHNFITPRKKNLLVCPKRFCNDFEKSIHTLRAHTKTHREKHKKEVIYLYFTRI